MDGNAADTCIDTVDLVILWPGSQLNIYETQNG